MLGIVADEVVEQAGELGRARLTSLDFQATLDQLSRASADQVAGGMQRHGRKALAREHEIERADQVGRGVDQGAVEIEDDSAGRGHAETAIGLGAIVQAGGRKVASISGPHSAVLACKTTLDSRGHRVGRLERHPS